MQEKIIMFGKPQYDGKIYDKFRLNENGELLLGKYVLNDGEIEKERWRGKEVETERERTIGNGIERSRELEN